MWFLQNLFVGSAGATAFSWLVAIDGESQLSEQLHGFAPELFSQLASSFSRFSGAGQPRGPDTISKTVIRSSHLYYPESMSEPHTLALESLQPSQRYLSAAKLAAVLDGFDSTTQFDDPLPVLDLDGEFVLADGHHRAFVAALAGADELTVVRASDDLDRAMYRLCVGWCHDAGIDQIGDLTGRLLDHETFEREWIGRCQNALTDE